MHTHTHTCTTSCVCCVKKGNLIVMLLLTIFLFVALLLCNSYLLTLVVITSGGVNTGEFVTGNYSVVIYVHTFVMERYTYNYSYILYNLEHLTGFDGFIASYFIL